jgi:antitoxin component YwqK of YwqJK toxin-antitoxin module
MKNISIVLIIMFISCTSFAQNINEPQYEKQGNLVAVTTYYEDGSIKEEGFYKDQKLHGEWNMYNVEGIKITKANYENGEKSGTWMFLKNGVVTEVKYENNQIASFHKWNHESKVAIK